jgi:osmotically-inducible protein OsmY
VARAKLIAEEDAVARAYCSINAFILSTVAIFAVGGAAACDNTARGLKQDAREAEVETRDERARVGDRARELGDDAVAAANRAAGAAAEAGEEIAERTGAAIEAVDVKAALMADPSVDATRIDVDTDYKTRTVTLNGLVPTHTERDMAEVIAKARAEGYRVVNNLTVKARS